MRKTKKTIPAQEKTLSVFILALGLISIFLITFKTSKAGFYQLTPTPTPSQDQVLITEVSNGELLIYLENSDGKRLIVDEDPNRVLTNQLSLSPDNNWVSLVKIDNQNDHFDLAGANIWLIDTQTGKEELLVDASQEFLVTNPLWSPDSSKIAYAKIFPGRSYYQTVVAELWLTDLHGNETLLVDNDSFGPAFFFGESFAIAWSLNGEAIQYYNEIGNEQVYEVDVATRSIGVAQSPYATTIEQYLQRIKLSRQQGYNGMTMPIVGLPEYQGQSANANYSTAYVDSYSGPPNFEGSGGHPGVDIVYGADCSTGVPGAEVVSVGEGVTWNFINTWQNQCDNVGSSFGNYAIIRSDNLPSLNGYPSGTYYFLYGHLYDISLVPGNFPVSKGQLIGHVGSTGNSGGPHLHFQLEPQQTQMHPWWFDNGGCSLTDGCGLNFQESALNNTDNPMMFIQAHMTAPGWGITACENDNLQGQGICELFTVDDPFLDENPIDKLTISSLQIPEYWQVKLFQDKYFQGTSSNTYYGPTTVPASELGLLNDQAESLILGAPLFCGPGDPLSLLNTDLTNPLDDCSPNSDEAIFITDITLPDGTVVSPNQSLVKTWRLRNTGTTTWGSGYQLVFINGDQMGAPGAVDVPATTPNQEVDISVNLTSPSTGAEYTGYWQLRNPQGTYFGLQIRVNIIVTGSNPPPPSNFTLTCLNCPATVPPGYTFRPTIHATVGSGQLLEARGDMLRNTDGNLYGAWPHIAVEGVVNPGQSYDFVFYEANPITAPSTDGTYQTRWQLWQDGQYVGDELTITFQVQQGSGENHPPNTPTLTGPGDWAVYYGNTGIVISAQQNGDPDGDPVNEYYFEIFESAQNANSGWITSNSWSPQGLGFNGYQWHVKVRDSRGAESGWSNTWHFNIINNNTQIFSFSAISCWDEWGGPEKLCFCADTNAGTLKVQVNDATDGSGNGEWHIINELGVPDYQCDSPDDNPPNWNQLEGETGTHLVRLYARGEGGWENAATADITVYLPPERRPNNPPNLLPLWESFLNTLQIQFDWDDSLRTDNYQLQVSDLSDFSTLLVNQTLPFGTTDYDYTLASSYDAVYWRVIANGPYGSNTSEGRFHPDIVPPSSNMTPLSPVTTDTVFSVNWVGTDDRSGLRWYHIQVKDGDHPTSEWADWMVNTTKTTELYSGFPGHIYYFRVRAMDAVGNWETWPAGDGDTFTLVDPSAAPPTAWWDENYAWKRNLILLNNDSDLLPVHYPMHIRFSDSTTPTALEIYNASLSTNKGDDVRVIYNNQVEIDRFIQQFDPSQIDIWFPLQANLGGGQTDSTNYQIYYGNSSAINPLANINNIFLPTADANTMGLWHFQDGSGNIIADSSGHGHNGSFNNGGWGDGWLGWAGIFNGIDTAVNAGNSGDFNLNAFTIEAWVYLNDVFTGNWPVIISKKYEGQAGGFTLRVTNDKNLFLHMDGNGMYSNVYLQPNQWYHIAAVFDGVNQGSFYINGNYAGGSSNLFPPAANNEPLLIGFGTYTLNPVSFPGMIQHVKVSNVGNYNFPYAVIGTEPSTSAGTEITPPSSGSPDLAILDLRTYPNLTGGVLIQAVVQNQGSRDLLNGFYTDLYVDNLPTGTGDYTGSIQLWVNDPIPAGAVITFTTVIDNLNLLFGNAPLTPASETTSILYAQTDSGGVVSEDDETNNIFDSGLEVCVAASDLFEGDDEYLSATLIGDTEIQTHNFSYPGDEDWVKFIAVEGETYHLNTFGLGNTSDTYLYLYDTDGSTLLASNDDYNGSLASHIDWVAPAGGTYYVRIVHWNPNVGGCGTTYLLSLQLPKVFLPIVVR